MNLLNFLFLILQLSSVYARDMRTNISEATLNNHEIKTADNTDFKLESNNQTRRATSIVQLNINASMCTDSDTLVQIIDALFDSLVRITDLNKAKDTVELVKSKIKSLQDAKYKTIIENKLKDIKERLKKEHAAMNALNNPEATILRSPDEIKTKIVFKYKLPELSQPTCKEMLSKLVQTAYNVFVDLAKFPNCGKLKNFDERQIFRDYYFRLPEKPYVFEIISQEYPNYQTQLTNSNIYNVNTQNRKELPASHYDVSFNNNIFSPLANHTFTKNYSQINTDHLLNEIPPELLMKLYDASNNQQAKMNADAIKYLNDPQTQLPFKSELDPLIYHDYGNIKGSGGLQKRPDIVSDQLSNSMKPSGISYIINPNQQNIINKNVAEKSPEAMFEVLYRLSKDNLEYFHLLKRLLANYPELNNHLDRLNIRPRHVFNSQGEHKIEINPPQTPLYSSSQKQEGNAMPKSEFALYDQYGKPIYPVYQNTKANSLSYRDFDFYGQTKSPNQGQKNYLLPKYDAIKVASPSQLGIDTPNQDKLSHIFEYMYPHDQSTKANTKPGVAIDQANYDMIVNNGKDFTRPGISNLYNLPTTTEYKEVIELTYILKKPKPLIYHPVFYVKLRLPYKTFLRHMPSMFLRKTKEHAMDFNKELMLVSNVTAVSPPLKTYNKEKILDLALRQGSLVRAKLLNSERKELAEQLDRMNFANYQLHPEFEDMAKKITDGNEPGPSSIPDLAPFDDVSSNVESSTQTSAPRKFGNLHSEAPPKTFRSSDFKQSYGDTLEDLMAFINKQE